MPLLPTLTEFFTRQVPVGATDRLLVAFSGGPDSTALLWGLARLRERLPFDLHAAHLDHALDPGSAARARAARKLARDLRVPFTAARRPVARARRSGESPEAAARRVRYDFLEEVREQQAADLLVTAHHRDDQVETVLLRWLQGSGLTGLGGMRPRHGRLVRPLLGLPRSSLREAVDRAGLDAVDDPTNRDPSVLRNRVRDRLRPRLEQELPECERRLLTLAAAAARVSDALSGRLTELLRPQAEAHGVSVQRASLAALPEELWPFALALLHRAAGDGYPPSRRVRRDLRRQVASPGRVGCDAGGERRWISRDDRLVLIRPVEARAIRPFAYTVRVPGEIELPEIQRRLRITRQNIAPWMFQGSPNRTALACELESGPPITVRNRRPGDRVRPLGCAYSRRLKELLIDRRVPRLERDRLPLVCQGDRILWVPGVTIDEDCRIGRNRRVWVAEIEV